MILGSERLVVGSNGSAIEGKIKGWGAVIVKSLP